MVVLRLVTEPPDAPLDPVKELIEARETGRRVATNPLLSEPARRVAETFARMLDRHLSYLNPKGRS
jgi:hypothetical protein